MKIEEQVCTMAQMQILNELGFDDSNASMCWIHYSADDEDYWSVTVHDEWCYETAALEPVPTFSIADMIDMLPKEDNYQINDKRYIYNTIKNNSVVVGDNGHYSTFYENNLLRDNLFDCLCWMKKNKYL